MTKKFADQKVDFIDTQFSLDCTFIGTVSWDRLNKFWQKFTELGLTKGRGRILNFLEAPMIL